MTNQDPDRSSTGVPGLDEILCGGYIPARIYLVEGSPGAGKTTMALQYLLDGLRRGERGLYVTLSETRDELAAGARSHGWSLDGIEVAELIPDGGEVLGDDEITMYHPAEVELTETMRKVVEVLERVKPRRMVFDSLSELRLLAQSSLRYRRQIMVLKQRLHESGCTVLLLDDRTASGPDLQLQSMTHGVLSMLHHPPAYGRSQRQLEVTKFRGSDFISGMQDFVIRRGGLHVFPRLAASDHVTDFRRDAVSSGVAELDALLGGGIDRGTATLLIGPPGTGKSTIALQYAVAAARRGDHAAMFSFEESPAILMERAQGLGMPFRVGAGGGEIALRRIDPAEVSPGEFAHLAREAVERNHARVLIIDSLNGYLNAMPEDRFLAAQLHELLAYLNNRGVSTFMVTAQSGAIGGVMRAPIDASYLADSVIMLRMFEHKGRVKKAVSVMKKRSGRHEETIRQVWFDRSGVHVGEPLMHLRGVLTGVPVEISASAQADEMQQVSTSDVH